MSFGFLLNLINELRFRFPVEIYGKGIASSGRRTSEADMCSRFLLLLNSIEAEVWSCLSKKVNVTFYFASGVSDCQTPDNRQTGACNGKFIQIVLKCTTGNMSHKNFVQCMEKLLSSFRMASR